MMDSSIDVTSLIYMYCCTLNVDIDTTCFGKYILFYNPKHYNQFYKCIHCRTDGWNVRKLCDGDLLSNFCR